MSGGRLPGPARTTAYRHDASHAPRPLDPLLHHDDVNKDIETT